ncbi:hypothetical protein Taro_009829 [Colocasia esculenta]|uniref:Uncharacterized protein n=1 Tax=Colocasia esculenta TaxID=4460 RepID=A0A843U553_COLES|nr:hypothetical protein [Colocasia esculenta]
MPTTEYYKAAEQRNASTTTRVRPNMTPTEPAESTHAEATPRHTPIETKELTEHRSNHVRPESHDTSTNIPDLHEVRKEQLGVTMRDTEQPREKHRLTKGAATSDLHKDEGPQAEPPYTSNTP